MPRRVTAIGSAFRSSEREGLRVLSDAIRLADGNLVRTAHLLGLARSHVYRLVYRHRMWPLVNQLRRRRARLRHEADLGA